MKNKYQKGDHKGSKTEKDRVPQQIGQNNKGKPEKGAMNAVISQTFGQTQNKSHTGTNQKIQNTPDNDEGRHRGSDSGTNQALIEIGTSPENAGQHSQKKHDDSRQQDELPVDKVKFTADSIEQIMLALQKNHLIAVYEVILYSMLSVMNGAITVILLSVGNITLT